jgi:hypothetical protein
VSGALWCEIGVSDCAFQKVGAALLDLLHQCRCAQAIIINARRHYCIRLTGRYLEGVARIAPYQYRFSGSS